MMEEIESVPIGNSAGSSNLFGEPIFVLLQSDPILHVGSPCYFFAAFPAFAAKRSCILRVR
jgi:hypothetical protein